MNLRQFMVRGRVLKLYREFLRSIKEIPDQSSKQELFDWVHKDFRKFMHETDEFKIRSLIVNGERSLKELQQNLELSGVSSLNKKEKAVKKQPVEKQSCMKVTSEEVRQ
ncbi:LYR motif-containing protein 2 [Gryllus bimaculatus]|nr:LYR motif-containing protein 2 [Gryllus bimaculatus]